MRPLRNPTFLPVVQFLGEPVGLEHPDGGEDRRKEPGGKGRYPEKPEGNQQLPVEQPGFVVPEVPVDPGREPVSGCQHLPGGEGIVGFHRIGDQQPAVAGKEQHQAQQQKQQCRPVPVIEAQQRAAVIFPVFHNRSPSTVDAFSIGGNVKGNINTIEGLVKEFFMGTCTKVQCKRLSIHV